MSSALGPVFRGEPGEGVLAWSPRTRLQNQVEARHFQETGIRLVLGAVWPPPSRPGRSALDEAVHQLRALEAFTLRRPEFSLALSSAQARGVGRIAVVPQLEGGEGIEDVSDVDRLWNEGARVITLVHFSSTSLGGAAKGQMAKGLLGLWPHGNEPQGLTAHGAEAVRRMIALGIVIDLAHASEKLTDDVLAITEPLGVPVLVSHTASRALMDMERNLSDAQAQQIVRSGGLIGVTLYQGQLEVEEAGRLAPHAPHTCDDFIAHYVHFARLLGPEALVLGSDLNSIINRALPGGRCPSGLRNAGDLPAVLAALEREGIARQRLDDMGERLLALWEAVEKKADEGARAQARSLRKTAAPKLLDRAQ